MEDKKLLLHQPEHWNYSFGERRLVYSEELNYTPDDSSQEQLSSDESLESTEGEFPSLEEFEKSIEGTQDPEELQDIALATVESWAEEAREEGYQLGEVLDHELENLTGSLGIRKLDESTREEILNAVNSHLAHIDETESRYRSEVVSSLEDTGVKAGGPTPEELSEIQELLFTVPGDLVNEGATLYDEFKTTADKFKKAPEGDQVAFFKFKAAREKMSAFIKKAKNAEVEGGRTKFKKEITPENLFKVGKEEVKKFIETIDTGTGDIQYSSSYKKNNEAILKQAFGKDFKPEEGKSNEDYVKELQKSAGMEEKDVDGKIGPKTWAALQKAGMKLPNRPKPKPVEVAKEAAPDKPVVPDKGVESVTGGQAVLNKPSTPDKPSVTEQRILSEKQKLEIEHRAATGMLKEIKRNQEEIVKERDANKKILAGAKNWKYKRGLKKIIREQNKQIKQYEKGIGRQMHAVQQVTNKQLNLPGEKPKSSGS